MQEEIYYFIQSNESRQLINIPMCGITFPDKNYSITRRNAKYMCIEYVESGEGVVSTDGETFMPVGGDSYMLCIDENQQYRSDSRNPWKKYWINLQGPMLKKLIEAYGLGAAHHFPGLNLQNELLEIINIATTAKEDGTSAVLEVLNRIFYKMYLHTGSKRSKDLGEKIKDYIDAHSAEPFNFADMEAALKKSQSRIIRVFKNKYGITPYAYYLERKIELAKSLLLNTNLLVKQIAYKLGFADEYYFCNVFSKREGVSPSQFRKNALFPPKL